MAETTASNPTADDLIAEVARAFHSDRCNHRGEEAMGAHREHRPCESSAKTAIAAFQPLIERSGLRLAVCDYCRQPCLAAKRSLCCGDSVSG